MQISFTAFQYWTLGCKGEKLWSFKDLISLFVIFLLIGSVSIMIVFFACKIYLHMKSASCYMSSKTLELSRQLFRMLTVQVLISDNPYHYPYQTIVPFFLMYIPIGIAIILPLFNLSIGRFINFSMVSVAIYPMTEPLIAIYFISDFRETLRSDKVIRYQKW